MMATIAGLLMDEQRRSSVVKVGIACGFPEFPREDKKSPDRNGRMPPRDRVLMKGDARFKIFRIVLG
jgi:hypothetical protein